MGLRFIFQVAGFGLVYALIMVVSMPFLVYWGTAKPWQKGIEFLMAFPVDNENVGIFSMPGMIAILFLNGLLWGIALIGLIKLGLLLKNLS